MADDKSFDPRKLKGDEARLTSPFKLYIGSKLVYDPNEPGGRPNQKKDAERTAFWEARKAAIRKRMGKS